MSSDFTTTSHGKCIIAGEHSVVRAHPAIATPLKQYQLTLHYRFSDDSLTIENAELSSAQLQQIKTQLIIKLQRDFGMLSGCLVINNQIPVGSGLGASAALCVAITRWLIAQNKLKAEQLANYATELENGFHGKSSGLDIAAASSNNLLWFEQGKIEPLPVNYNPYWYLSYCGTPGNTAECIARVNKLWTENPGKAQIIDEQMVQAVKLTSSALKQANPGELARALKLAQSCFEQWDLISPALARHIKELRQQGAIATKPTGSGGGGYVLSLWNSPQQAPGLTPVSIG